MTDFAPFEPMLRGTPASGVVVRPAGPDDAPGVARLLTLRGISAEEAREQAPRMIEALPVLLLALLSAAEVAAGDESGGADHEAEAPPDDVLLAPIALSGAFPLPERMRASLPEASADADAWMVSGLVVDPVARRRGVGRVLLTAITDAVRALQPAAALYSIVSATNHASVGLHLVVGFERLARLEEFGAVTFEGGQGVLLRRTG